MKCQIFNRDIDSGQSSQTSTLTDQQCCISTYFDVRYLKVPRRKEGRGVVFGRVGSTDFRRTELLWPR